MSAAAPSVGAGKPELPVAGGSAAESAMAPARASNMDGGTRANAPADQRDAQSAGASGSTSGIAGMSGSASLAAGSGGQPSDAGVAVMQTCPPAAALKPGDSTHTLQSGNHMRDYLVHVPASYTGTTPVPLVFDFHGYSSNAQQQMGLDGFRELADKENFVVVYPDGVGTSWNVNGCCGQAGDEMLDEIAFVRAIMDAMKRDACIDLKRVYATGISQGGGMAHHVACLAADIFAATAPVSSDLRTDPCTPSRPITEISFRGLADSLDNYDGGHVGPPGMAGYTAIGAKATLDRWKTIDMCTGPTTTMDQLCETYTTCAGGVEVSLCSIPGADHVLYTNPENFDVASVAWAMFKKHPM